MKSAAAISGLFLCVLLACDLQAVDAGDRKFLNFKSFRPLGSRGADEKATASLGDQFETKVETPLIGERVAIRGMNLVLVQGVGLVVGLDGTGGDPSPSPLRSALADDMRRRKVKPGELLRSPNTALVIVRAYLPVLVEKGEHFDVEVRLPDESNAASLHGGYLLETYLTEQAVIPGRGVLKGFAFATARGPVLITAEDDADSSQVGLMQRGKILAGGTSLKERDLKIYLRNDFKSIRNSKRIADAIGERFFAYNQHGLREELSEAKTDQEVVLKILPRYKDNYPRYLQVVRNIAFHESEVARQVRMQQLQQEFKNPANAEHVALQLEAIGSDAVPTLRTGLKHSALEVRFHAAMALTYLGETDGLQTLIEAARNEPAFRVHAFAAMAASDDAQAALMLRELLGETSAETRYGAFRALTTLDENDPFVRGEDMNGQFKLHVLHTEGPPMVHITNHRKAEVALFGARQRLRTPLAIRAGNHILVKAEGGAGKAVVSRFAVGEREKQEAVSLEVADVIRAAVQLGATYPDVAQMLSEAGRQHNMEGQFQIDALPEAGRVYFRPQAGDAPTEARLTEDMSGNDDSLDESNPPSTESRSGSESLAGASDSGDEKAFDLLRFFRRE